MILNHKAAIELLCEQASDIALDRYTICNLHAVLSENLVTDPEACGRLRSRGVGITGTVFHPLEVPQMIEECFDIILHKASTSLIPRSIYETFSCGHTNAPVGVTLQFDNPWVNLIHSD